MKKILSIIAMILVLALSTVVAYDSEYVPDSVLELPPTGVSNVDYCVWQTTAHINPVVGLDVNVFEVCEDVDSVYGCGGSDVLNPAEFVVTLDESQTQADGCVGVTITTTDADGVYYFTLNGDTGVSVVTRETGVGYIVPEFGVVAAGLTLALAGLFIYKKRN